MEDTKEFVKEKLDEMHEEGIIDTERYEALYEDLGTVGNIDDELFNTLNTDTRVIIGDIFDELYHQIEEQYNEMSLSELGIELNLDALEHKELLELSNKMDILESKVTSLVNDPEHYFSYKKWQKYDSSSTLNDTYADTMSDDIPHKALNFNTEEFRTKLIETHNSVETKFDYIKQLEPDLYIDAIDLVGFSKEELYQVKQLADELNLKIAPDLLEDGVCKEIFGNTIDNSYMVDDYFKNNYPNITEENKTLLVKELPYLKNDIVNGLNTSSSVKQLLTIVNSDKQELELNDIYLLDRGEQSILSNIAKEEGLTINSDIKGTPFEETFGKLPESKKSKAKSNEMEM